MNKYYVLGIGYKDSDIDKSHPFEVWLDLQQEHFPIVMMEGKGVGGVGGNFKPSEILQEHWEEHLRISGTQWLKSLCEEARMNKDILESNLVVESYKHRYGCMPHLKNIG